MPVALKGTRLGPVTVPELIYGTAWKEERTSMLTRQALEAGFRGIDTANQRRHYHEAGVGDALRGCWADGIVTREELFLQTKFTHRSGQDHRLPYDARAPVALQVEQSVRSSLEHLGATTLDALLLHGPSQPVGLGEEDLAAWRGMEASVEAGHVRVLGVSNVNLEQLEEIERVAKVPPRIVQNRTFTRPSADRAVRDHCRRKRMVYEGFSLLTARPDALAHPEVMAAAVRLDASPAQAVLAYCRLEGITILTGTSSREHMRQDLAATSLQLTADERAAFTRLYEGPRRVG